MNRTLGWGIFNGAAAGALWGIIFLLPAALRTFTPLQLCLGRYLTYGVISIVLIFPRRIALWAQIGRRDWMTLAWLGLTGNLAYYGLVAVAVQTTGGAATSLVVGLVPVVIAIAAMRDPAAVPIKRLAPSLALSVAGVALVAYTALNAANDAAKAPSSLVGLLCAAGALLSWSAYSVANRTALTERPTLTNQDWSLLTGLVTGALTLAMVPATIVAPSKTHAPSEWFVFWALCTAVSVFSSILGNACWNRASRALPLSLSGQMIVFETLFALLYSFLWQRRWPQPLEVVAIVCLLASVALCARTHRQGQVAVTTGP